MALAATARRRRHRCCCWRRPLSSRRLGCSASSRAPSRGGNRARAPHMRPLRVRRGAEMGHLQSRRHSPKRLCRQVRLQAAVSKASWLSAARHVSRDAMPTKELLLALSAAAAAAAAGQQACRRCLLSGDLGLTNDADQQSRYRAQPCADASHQNHLAVLLAAAQTHPGECA